MSRPKARTALKLHGHSLPLPARLARSFAGRKLAVSSCSSRHLLIGVEENGDRLALAGDLAELAVPDLLSFLNMFRKTGVLHCSLHGGEKRIFFEQGEVVFAASNIAEEGLGEILLALGKLSRAKLDEARAEAGGRATVGKLLVERKIVSPQDLWQANRAQVEQIVYHLFTFHQGDFCFIAKELDQESILRLTLNTQNLIMEGLRRVDERGLFLKKIGSLDATAVVVGKLDGLSKAELALVKRVADKGGSVRDLLRRSGQADYEGLRLIYQLLEKKVLQMNEVAEAEVVGDFADLLQVFNGALKVLYDEICAFTPGFSGEVRAFLAELPQPYSFVFRDVDLNNDGSIEGGRILENLADMEPAERVRLLADALNELLHMECMAARRDLGPQRSEEMIARVQKISRRVKDLLGRKT